MPDGQEREALEKDRPPISAFGGAIAHSAYYKGWMAARDYYRAALAAREDGSRVAATGDTRKFILCDDGTWHMPRENPPVVDETSLLVVPASAAREDVPLVLAKELRRVTAQLHYATHDRNMPSENCPRCERIIRLIPAWREKLAARGDTERPCPHCGKLMLIPGRNYEIDPAAVCKCGGREDTERPTDDDLTELVEIVNGDNTYRVQCSCGWSDYGFTRPDAGRKGSEHLVSVGAASEEPGERPHSIDISLDEALGATDAEKIRALKEGLEQVAAELCELTDFETVEMALEDAGSAIEWEASG